MIRLKHIALALSLAVLACSLSAVSIAANAGHASTKASAKGIQKAEFLFVLRADSAVIAKTNGNYTITLKDIDDKVIYFSDRPQRLAGSTTVAQFMKSWSTGKDSFKNDPPNGAIIYSMRGSNDTGKEHARLVTFENPVHTPDGWMFTLKNLGNKDIMLGDYNGVSVFVDTEDMYGVGCGPIIWGIDGC